jgi:hypothetical protein
MTISSYDLPATISRGWPWLGPVNLDWYAGPTWQKSGEFLAEKGILNLPYLDNVDNPLIIQKVMDGIDSITLGNVLNDFASTENRLDILKSILHTAEEYGNGIFCKLLVSVPNHEHSLDFYRPELNLVFGEMLVTQEKGFLWAMIPTRRAVDRFFEENFREKEKKDGIRH